MQKKVKIAINTRFLLPNKLEGIGTYSHQVLQRLVQLMPEVEFHFLFDRNFSEEFIYSSNVYGHKLSPQARHPFLWYWWFEKSISKWLKKNSVDIFISPDSFLSLKTNTPTFLIMHDLAFEHYPEHVPYLVRHYYKYFFPKYAAKATKIFAVSKFTKEDIGSKYKIDPSKIELAYCGVANVYNPLSNIQKKEIQKKLTNSLPYFICVGSLNPRKNIQTVVKAFNLLKENYSKESLKYQLVIVGAKGWKINSLTTEIQNSKFKKDILLTGHINPSILSNYLASSEALIFPSLFEGFGIPIIEAYKTETPVITSNLSSTKEIGEDCTILLNPTKAEEIQGAMLSIINNNTLSQSFINNRKEKLKIYNWDKTAVKIQKEIITFLNS